MSRRKKFDLDKVIKHTRELRQNMTDSEKILWNELRGRKLSGYKFLRQHPILYGGNLLRYNYFVADFYCAEKKTIIELDGFVHNSMVDYDEFRDSELEYLGYRILRIKNEELEDLQDVLSKILDFINQIPG